jgi:predicted RNA-binding protein with PIN domain
MARIIIDGYNLMAKLEGAAGTLESRRGRLIRLLSQFNAGRGHAITVVFDAERGDWPSESYDRMLGIDIVFSRMGEKADHVIKRMSEGEEGESIIVSSDREVASYAETCGHVAIRAEDFIKRLFRTAAAPQEADKGEEDEKTVTSTVKKGNPRRLSKAARRRAQKLRIL